MMGKTQSSTKQLKRAPTRGSFKPGVSGNPGGRPKDGETFAAVLRDLLSKDGPEVAAICKNYSRDFKTLPSGVNLRAMIALRWITSLLNEPTPGLLQTMIERTDGVLTNKIGGDEAAPFTIRVEYVRRDNSANRITSGPTDDQG